MLAHFYAGLRDLFETLFGERIDYYALHPATVVAQRANGTLDVRADARPDGLPAALQDLTSIPIDIGLPGAEVTVNRGTRVLVGFRGGDPQQRYASLTSAAQVKSIAWESGQEFKVLASKHTFAEAGRATARQGDLTASIGPVIPDPTLATGIGCLIQLIGPFPPVGPPPPFAPFGLAMVAKIQFTPKPLISTITTAKASFKI